MTIQEMHDYFDLICDEYNSPYFIAVEKDIFINQAQEEFVNRFLFNNILSDDMSPKDPVQFLYHVEDKIQSSEILQPLIIADKPVIFSGALLSLASLNSIANVEKAGSRMLHIMRLETSATNTGNILPSTAFRFIRHNDIGRFKANVFKAPATHRPYMYLSASGVHCLPQTGVDENAVVSLLRSPVPVSITTPTDCELPISTHKTIARIAIRMAGVPIGDATLMQAPSI